MQAMDLSARVRRIGESATLKVTLANPQGSFLYNLGWGDAVIVAPESAATNMEKPIGTGPFRYGDWVPDSHMLLERFDGYAANTSTTGPNGFGGRKTVWVDRVRLRFLPEASARVAAALWGHGAPCRCGASRRRGRGQGRGKAYEGRA